MDIFSYFCSLLPNKVEESNPLAPYPMLKKHNNLVIQSNKLLHAFYDEPLTFWETFLFARMCSLIQPQDLDFKEYIVYTHELLSYCQVATSGEAYQLICQAAKRLLDRKIQISDYNKTGDLEIFESNLVISYTRLAKVRPDQDSYIRLCIHPRLRPYLLQLRRDFSQFQLSSYRDLHSHGSIRIYEILTAFHGRGQNQVVIEVDELKGMLGVRDSYERFSNFKSKVLDPAQERLAECTELSFEYEVLRKGRSAYAIRFDIHRETPKFDLAFEDELGMAKINAQKRGKSKSKPQKEIIIKEIAASEEETFVINLSVYSPAQLRILKTMEVICTSWGMSPETIHKLLQSYEPEAIDKALRYMRFLFQKEKEILNPAGLFIQCVREGYTNPQVEREIKLEAAQKRQAQRKIDDDHLRLQKEAHLREAYQREKTALFRLLEVNPKAEAHILALASSGPYTRRYALGEHPFKPTLLENMDNALLSSILLLAAKELFPLAFD